MITGQLTPAQYAKQLAIKAVTLLEDSGFFCAQERPTPSVPAGY